MVRLVSVTLFEQLPSLGAACRPRFGSGWPSGTRYSQGRLRVGEVFVEDVADCHGTPVHVGAVVVARVRSVIAGTVRIDASGEVLDAAIANRHSLVGGSKFAIGDGKVELPADVRAGDVLALIYASEAPVPGHP